MADNPAINLPRSIGDVPGLQTALNGRALVKQAKCGNRAVFLGDSITLGYNTGGASIAIGLAGNWPWVSSLISRQRIRFVHNAGVSADTLAMMLARLDTDVIAYDPDICFIEGGINDIATGVPFATSVANLTSIVDALRAEGIVPILLTILPNNTAGYQAGISKWNLHLSRYAEAEQITLVNANSLFTDPANGNFLASYYGDATHPNLAGHLALADLVNTTVAPILPINTPLLPTSNTDANNLIANGLFLTDAGGDGLADGWSKSGTGVASLVTDVAVKGNLQKVVASAGNTYIFRTTATGWSVGDRILVTSVITASGVAPRFDITVSGSTHASLLNINQVIPLTNALINYEFVVPAGATSIGVFWGAGPGDGYVQLGQAAMYNLTTLGID